MARIKPFRRVQIDEGICAKIDAIKERQRYRGSFTSLVESILDSYADGLPFEVSRARTPPTEVERVYAVRNARRVGEKVRKSA